MPGPPASRSDQPQMLTTPAPGPPGPWPQSHCHPLYPPGQAAAGGLHPAASSCSAQLTSTGTPHIHTRVHLVLRVLQLLQALHCTTRCCGVVLGPRAWAPAAQQLKPRRVMRSASVRFRMMVRPWPMLAIVSSCSSVCSRAQRVRAAGSGVGGRRAQFLLGGGGRDADAIVLADAAFICGLAPP